MKRVVLALALCAASGFQKPTAARPGTQLHGYVPSGMTAAQRGPAPANPVAPRRPRRASREGGSARRCHH